MPSFALLGIAICIAFIAACKSPHGPDQGSTRVIYPEIYFQPADGNVSGPVSPTAFRDMFGAQCDIRHHPMAWRQPHELGMVPVRDRDHFAIAGSDEGFLAVWLGVDGLSGPTIRSATFQNQLFASLANWSSPTSHGAQGQNLVVDGPVGAVNNDGAAAIAWSQEVSPGRAGIFAAVRSNWSQWDATELMYETGVHEPDLEFTAAPYVSIGTNGDIGLSWISLQVMQPSQQSKAFSRIKFAGHAWGPIRWLNNPTTTGAEFSFQTAVLAADDGAMAVFWHALPASIGGASGHPIRLSRYFPSQCVVSDANAQLVAAEVHDPDMVKKPIQVAYSRAAPLPIVLAYHRGLREVNTASGTIVMPPEVRAIRLSNPTCPPGSGSPPSVSLSTEFTINHGTSPPPVGAPSSYENTYGNIRAAAGRQGDTAFLFHSWDKFRGTAPSYLLSRLLTRDGHTVPPLYQPPVTLSTDSNSTVQGDIAVSGTGEGMAVWIENGALRWSRLIHRPVNAYCPAAWAWSAPDAFPPITTDARAVRLATGADEAFAAIWITHSGSAHDRVRVSNFERSSLGFFR